MTTQEFAAWEDLAEIGRVELRRRQMAEKKQRYVTLWHSAFGLELDAFDHAGDAKQFADIVDGQVYDKYADCLIGGVRIA